jgi:hypothetical protein
LNDKRLSMLLKALKSLINQAPAVRYLVFVLDD